MDVTHAPRDFFAHFAAVKDPRVDRTKRHALMDILVIGLLGVICGADGWTDVAEFGRAKQAWLKTFLELPNGIPSHDTFGRVFAALDPDELEGCFAAFTRDLAEVSGGELIALDGKMLRRSFQGVGRRAAIDMVSAWCAGNRLVLGQLATEDKSNEITALPKLLDLLELRGAVVTIDAAGCQKEIAAKIVDKGGDYILSVKANQPTLHEEVKLFLDDGIAQGWEPIVAGRHQEVEGDHGRVETRTIWGTDQVEWLRNGKDWVGLRSLLCVECHREVMGGKTSTERRYFISTLTSKAAKTRLAEVRGHWGVENSLHWVLDVAFREDECRVRMGHAPENLSRMRRLALNLLRKDTHSKVGIAIRRKKAGWNLDYLLGLLSTPRNY
jgi:predicted transposase YbfD/YdcC